MKKVLSSLELLNDLAICCTGERIMVSQVAVLTTVARLPGATSGMIANHTGLSLPSVGRLLGYLINSGDVAVLKKYSANGNKVRRRFYITPQGVKTVNNLLRHMRWTMHGQFSIVPIRTSPRNIFEL